jgi:hypothetical protein
MQTIKTMWKAIFQNKLTIDKANLPAFVQKIIKRRCYVHGLISRTSADTPPENGGVKLRLIESILCMRSYLRVLGFVQHMNI